MRLCQPILELSNVRIVAKPYRTPFGACQGPCEGRKQDWRRVEGQSLRTTVPAWSFDECLCDDALFKLTGGHFQVLVKSGLSSKGPQAVIGCRHSSPITVECLHPDERDCEIPEPYRTVAGNAGHARTAGAFARAHARL